VRRDLALAGGVIAAAVIILIVAHIGPVASGVVVAIIALGVLAATVSGRL
jgi:hypothetical protein